MSDKDIQDNLSRLASLDTIIRVNIAEYNRVAGLANTDMRMALLTATSYLEEQSDEDQTMTHEEYMKNREGPPNPSIDCLGADWWFPSGICIEY